MSKTVRLVLELTVEDGRDPIELADDLFEFLMDEIDPVGGVESVDGLALL